MNWKAFLGKSYTRQELMDDALWLLLLLGGLQIQTGFVQAILARSLMTGAIVFLAIGAGFVLLAMIPRYWGKFSAMIIWTGVLMADFYVRHNPFTLLFILIGLSLIFKMIRFRNNCSS